MIINVLQKYHGNAIDECHLGDFKENKKSGTGAYYFANKNKYIGDWVNDQKSGQGIFIFANGDRYEMTHSQMLCPR